MTWWNRNRVQLSGELYQTAAQHASQAGYSSVEEFVEHCVRKEVERSANTEDPSPETDDEILKARLRGLGYVE